jgi:hypothetical protein
MTEIHERHLLRARMARAAKRPHSHYLIAGLAVGGLWLLNAHKSLLYHAVQMLIVMSVLTTLQIALDRRHDRTPAYARLIGAKLALIVVAVGAGWLLAPVTSRSNTIVAVGLVVLIAAVGPVLDRLAARRAKAATGPDQAHRPADPPGRGINTLPGHSQRGSAGPPITGRKNPMTSTTSARLSTGVSRFRRAWRSRTVSTRKDRSHV